MRIFVLMKKNSLLIFLLSIANCAFCQLQNASFELWDVTDPSGWATSNFYDPGTAIQSTDAHGGAFALNMNVIADSTGTPIAPYATTYFGLTTMPEVLTFWIKGNLQGNNNVNASFNLAEVDSTTNVLAYGDITFTNVSNVYQYKFINILQLGNPSLLGQGSVYFAIGADVGNSLHLNSTVYIDDLYLGADNTALKEPKGQTEIIEQLYPNPAQETSWLIFNQKKYGKVSLKVVDLMGNLVQVVLDESLTEGRYKAEINTAPLEQGIYFCKLTIENTEYCVKLIKV